MSHSIKRDASFIVRIWWERKSHLSAVWRGQIIHVQTGQSRFLRDENALIRFIRHWSGAADEEEDDIASTQHSSTEEWP